MRRLAAFAATLVVSLTSVGCASGSAPKQAAPVAESVTPSNSGVHHLREFCVGFVTSWVEDLVMAAAEHDDELMAYVHTALGEHGRRMRERVERVFYSDGALFDVDEPSIQRIAFSEGATAALNSAEGRINDVCADMRGDVGAQDASNEPEAVDGVSGPEKVAQGFLSAWVRQDVTEARQFAEPDVIEESFYFEIEVAEGVHCSPLAGNSSASFLRRNGALAGDYVCQLDADGGSFPYFIVRADSSGDWRIVSRVSPGES